MDTEKKKSLIEMLIANSGPMQTTRKIITSDQDEHLDSLSYNRDSISRMKYNYAMQRLIVEYFNYSSLQLTVADIQQSFMAAIIDLAGDPQVIEAVTGETIENSSSATNAEYPIDTTVEESNLVEVFLLRWMLSKKI